MATSKERDKEHPKGHLAMKTPPIVSQQEWEAARQQLLVKEKALTRSRDALAAERRRMPWMAVEKKYEFDGPKGKVSLLDLFEGRRQLIVYRAFFEPGVFGWPEHACRGCSFVRRSGRPPGPSERSRHHPRVRLARAAGGHRAPEGTNGLEDALVHHHGQLRHRLRRGRVARHERVHPRWRQGVPHLLHQQPRRRADGEHLELSRHHCARAPGGVGGLARGLPQTPPYKWWNWHDNYDAEASPDPKWVEVIPTLEKPPSESATQRRKRAKEGRPLAPPSSSRLFFTQELRRVLPQARQSERSAVNRTSAPPRARKGRVYFCQDWRQCGRARPQGK